MSRRLAEFERLGIIRILTRSSIEILDIAGLARTAGLLSGTAA